MTAPLNQVISRQKARWLKFVMHESKASATEKCLAYTIADALNCVTLDCWPSQPRLARLLGGVSVRTVQRAARGLEQLGLITIRRPDAHSAALRYAPRFPKEPRDKTVHEARQHCRGEGDTNVRESSLEILFESSSTASPSGRGRKGPVDGSFYSPLERGRVEVELADRLGRDGMQILERFGAYDDRVVERLCRAHAAGQLGDSELHAARLAAKQLLWK